ncbi:MAG: serine/threonine protein kinase [Proteobacteria bacterium]|nr:serine/threonine protein kinase [Pseudomonadota bacterium]
MARTNSTKRVDIPSDRIGAYTVIDQVGEGGMAKVYRVKGPGGRVHALKELRPQREAVKEMQRRFKQEFDVTSKLSHRNIVSVRDFFAAQETLHLVMEWVDGMDLRDVLRFAGTLDDGRVASVGAEVASGLAAAHAQQVLHRDLKPENVLLSKRGQVKVTDFGVARVMGTRLTATGIIVGSPAYMSPEQLAGVSGQKLSPASDIYSLGVMLYELGEGRDPLGLRKHEDLLTVLKAKRDKRPKKMRRVEDPELAELILHCLEPEEEDRPSEMDKVARALRRIARRAKVKRADTEFLVATALDNRRNKRKSKGAPAPLRPLEEKPPADAPDPEASAPWKRFAERRRARDDRPAAPPPRVEVESERGPPPARSTPVDLRPEPPPIPSPESWDRVDRAAEDLDFGTASRRISRVTELSVKRLKARAEGSMLSWLVLLLLALGVIFLAASASLTGSPLGLLEVLVPMP